ncbi:unnamed protein product [Durusdinium trenchii]|uniref:Transmembrane protein n=2 Tax=Durusdinium trenchii TaxID=1381693 RepID=A0ABP0HHV9_9DINO|eukprot:g12810.t1
MEGPDMQVGSLLPEESDDQATDFLVEAQREVRFARRCAISSMLLAGAAVTMLVATVFQNKSASSDVTQATVLDNTVYPTFPGVPLLSPGWARCITNAVVREGHNPESPKVAVVREKTKVLVAEVRGRRVRIEEPIHGWVSSMSSDGIEVIRMLEGEKLRDHFKRDIDRRSFPKNQSAQESFEQLRAELLKLKGSEGQLMGLMERVVGKLQDKAKVHAYADVATDGATQVVQKLQDTIQSIDLDKFDAKQMAEDFLKGKVHLGDINIDFLKSEAPQTPRPSIDIVE